ncbi:MAG: hypothetical protein ABJB01_06015 [Rudaea sp.]
MATRTGIKRSAAVNSSLMDDLIDARAIWSEHMAVIGPNAMELIADVGKMAVELANSRLGQRARRYPEISFAVGVMALGMVSKILRFR